MNSCSSKGQYSVFNQMSRGLGSPEAIYFDYVLSYMLLPSHPQDKNPENFPLNENQLAILSS